MALSYKARRRWSLVVLLIWLPFYIIVVATVMTAIPRLPMLVELLIYLVLGVAWAIPFKFIFKGVGKEDTDA
jgi:hypothetical protein